MKISLAQKGKKKSMSKIGRENVRKSHLGKTLTDERKLKISNSMKKYWENKNNSK